MFTKDLQEVVNHIFKEYDFQSKPDSRATPKDTCSCPLSLSVPENHFFTLYTNTVFKLGPCQFRLVSHNLGTSTLSGYIHTFSLLSRRVLGNHFPAGIGSSSSYPLSQRLLISQCQTHTSSILNSKKGRGCVCFLYSHLPSVWHIMNSQKTFFE